MHQSLLQILYNDQFDAKAVYGFESICATFVPALMFGSIGTPFGGYYDDKSDANAVSFLFLSGFESICAVFVAVFVFKFGSIGGCDDVFVPVFVFKFESICNVFGGYDDDELAANFVFIFESIGAPFGGCDDELDALLAVVSIVVIFGGCNDELHGLFGAVFGEYEGSLDNLYGAYRCDMA